MVLFSSKVSEGNRHAIVPVGMRIVNNSDLRVEAILKDNSTLLNLLEQIKEMEGVKDVVWSEIVSIVGQKYRFLLQLLT